MPNSDCFCFASILRNLLSLLCKFDDISDAALCHNLIVCIESKYFMKLISKVSSCIGRLISCSWNCMQVHFSQCRYDLFCCVFFFQLLFQYPIDHQWKIADQKVCLYSVFSGKIYRSCTEFCFHDSERFFDFPSLFTLAFMYSLKSSASSISKKKFVH